MAKSSKSNTNRSQGLVSFQELEGGSRSSSTGLFSKILERVRTSMALEPLRAQTQTQPQQLTHSQPQPSTHKQNFRSSILENDSTTNLPFQSLHLANSFPTSVNSSNYSVPTITSSEGISPPFSSSSSVVGLDVVKATPSISYKENKTKTAHGRSSSSSLSLTSAFPSFLKNSGPKKTKYAESDTFSDELTDSFSEHYTENVPPEAGSSRRLSSGQPSLPSTTSKNYEPAKNHPFYQLGEAAQGSAASLFSSRPSDAMTMILRRLQGQGEGLNRDYWMKDEHCHSCYNCKRTFNPLLRRKHHCRICGQIFCSDCTSKMIPGDSLGQPGLIRVCDYCYRLRQSCQSVKRFPDGNTALPNPPGVINTTTHSVLSKERKLDEHHLNKSPTGLASPKEDNVEGLKKLLTAGTRVADGRSQEASPFRQRATLDDDSNIALSPTNNMESIVIPNDTIVDDPDADTLYSMISGFKGSILSSQPSDAGDLHSTDLPRTQSQVGRSLMHQSITSPNARKLMRKLTVTSLDTDSPVVEHTRSKSTCEVQLNIASLQHIRHLLRELLNSYQIDSAWEDIITSLALKAAHRLELDVKDGDSMDIRRYVKIKRIPGGVPSDTEYINGVVCSKTLTHKTMLRTLTRPRILILTFPFEYQRVEYQFSSLDPLLAQESEHLKNMVARVLALRPTLVIVEKSIARIALEFLHKANLCVAMNVKPSVIRALARCTQAEVISSLDKLRQEPKLGNCQKFEVRTYMHELIPQWRKSYFFFSGCEPSLGCTIVLRGGDIKALGKLKRVIELTIYAAYCLKLETVLLRDQLAMIPNQLESCSISDLKSTASQNNLSGKAPNSDLDENDVDAMLQPYRTKTLSTSPFVKFPPPYLLIKMKEEAACIRELQEKQQLITTSKLSGGLDSPSSEDSITDSRLELGLNFQKEGATAVDEHRQNLRTHQVFLESFQPPVSPFSHQSITILYCNVSTTETTICQAPQSYTIDYYQSSDLTLGQFLELSCFDLSVLCGTCDKSVLKHLRSYVHSDARVTVTVEELPSPITGMEGTILMWSYCKLCDKVLPVVPMSEETWKFSLGKYLELSFYHAPLSCRAGMCPHDIHRDHVRYFGLRDLAARFEYEPIDLMEIRVPPTKLFFKPEISQRLKHQDFETLRQKINQYWDSVSDKVKMLLTYSISAAKPEQCRQELTEMSRRVAAERSYVLQVLQQTYVNSHPTDTLALNLVLRVIHEKVIEWDSEFAGISQKYLQTESDLRRLTTHQLRRLFPDRDMLGPDSPHHHQFLRDLALEGTPKEPMPTEDPHMDILPVLSSSPSDFPDACWFPDALDQLPTRQTYIPVMNSVIYRRHSLKLMREEKSQREERAASLVSSPVNHNPITPISNTDKPADDYMTAGSKRFIPRVTPSYAPASARASVFEDYKMTKNASAGSIARLNRPTSNRNSPVTKSAPKINCTTPNSTPRGSSKPPVPASTLLSTPTSRGPSTPRVAKPRPGTRFVERRGTDRAPRIGPSENNPRLTGDRKIRRAATTATGRPSRLSRPSIAVYSSARDAVEEESDSDEESRPRELQIASIAGAYPGLEGGTELNNVPDSDDFGPDPALGVLGLGEELLPHQTPSLMPEMSRDDEPLPNDFSSEAPPPEIRDGGYDRGSIIQTLSTFLGGPSSIGSISLDYPLQPTEHLFADSPIVIREDEPSSAIAFTLSSRDYLEQMKKIQKTPPGSPDRMIERELQAKEGTHLRYQLGEGAIRMTCKVFFAHHFDALRRHCDQDSLYVESLARCVKWSASGGKSGSIFLKTRDDRLVMKEVSKAELDAFLKFAPLYFSHMAEALFEGLPALLAKIFGLYRISIKNIHSGRSVRIDVLIMENLFYERKISRIFDLKGSLRNRLVQSTGKENEVLLDENLMEMICHSPIFIRAHSKQLLHMAIFNDTKFLSGLKVMDYSLLVGIDEERHELVVGMVDFIRTFTWDKKLESWVKENTFLGREQPTIVSPSLYKHRFRSFMDKYFLMVPDKYYIPSVELKLPRTSNN